MERFKGKTFIFKKEFWIQAMIVLGMTSALVACGNDGGDAVVPPPIGIVANCASCGEINQSPMTLSTFSASNAQGSVQLGNVQLIGSGVRLMTQSTPLNTPYASYYGPVTVQGQFIANTQLFDPSSGCMIPPGSYTLSALNAGTLGYPAGGNLELPDLIAQPGNIRMRIAQGILYSSGSKLMGILQIVSANGRACGPMFVDNLY